MGAQAALPARATKRAMNKKANFFRIFRVFRRQKNLSVTYY